ncbi:NlpE-like protein with OB domain [Filimonas lacunae]|uniref:NlpE-like protein with OB domain n=1 Tax=Filimonas lacunae TaxID=477680 RepID=A0A173MPL7_9BACT|nr:copper resistance protein NlpE N-terminal domain-containing protein [Filimonas lacunae]BAV09592.1 copper homeostasis protein Cut [Filimonas lacunae]SIS75649.1 NlpE-like protein with OB domain [Filimonas lacunae]
MRVPANILLAFACLFTAVSCNNTTKTGEKKDTVNKVVSPFTGKILDGLFADTLPCADCEGIITVLDLNADSTFTLEQEYLGTKEGGHISYQLGKWSAVDSILTLNEITEGNRQYKIVGTNELQTLDNEGVIITGTKVNYTLHRQTGKFAPKKAIQVRGMLAYSDTSRIKICGWGKEYAVTYTPEAATAIKTAAAKIKSKPGERVLTEAEGKFVTQLGVSSSTPKESFVIEKFVKFLPGEKCRY